MARKSPWQEFAENFQGVYGTFKQIGQDVETSRIMDDEKFTAEGGLGAGLKGRDLERARYKALGDIYTKYGNAKEGLAMRTQLADLDAKDRENTIQQNIMQELIKQRGTLQSGLMAAQTNQAAGAGALSFSKADTENAMRDGRVEGQRLQNIGYGIGNNQANLDYQIGVRTADGQVDATNAQNNSIVARAPLADDAANAQSQSIINRADSADAAAIDQNILASQQARSDLSLEDLRTQAGAEQYRQQVYQAYAAGNQAKLDELQTLGFLDYADQYSKGTFKTAEEAKDAYLNVIAKFDPTKAMEMAEKYSADEIGALANQGIKFQTEMNKILQQPGKSALTAAADFFDAQNGEDTGVTFRQTSDGYEMFETADGKNVGTIFQGLSLDEAKSALQGLTTYGNATNYAEKLFARKKAEQGMQKVGAEIKLSEARVRAIDASITNDSVKADLDKAQTDLVREKIADALQNRTEGLGMGDKEKIFIEESARFLSSYIREYADDLSGLDDAYAQFKESLNSDRFTIEELD